MDQVTNMPVDTMQVIVKVVRDAQTAIRLMVGFDVELRIMFPKNTDSRIEAHWTKIRQTLCVYSGLTWEQIVAKNRCQDRVMLRAAYCYIGRQTIAGRSLKQIGRDIGGRDHTTVIHMTKVFDDMLATGFLPAVEIYLYLKKNMGHEN